MMRAHVRDDAIFRLLEKDLLMERETDRFTVRAEDGRAWVFRKMRNYTEFQGQHLPGSYRYESLDDGDRYHLVETGEGFAVRDFRTDGPDIDVTRV